MKCNGRITTQLRIQPFPLVVPDTIDPFGNSRDLGKTPTGAKRKASQRFQHDSGKARLTCVASDSYKRQGIFGSIWHSTSFLLPRTPRYHGPLILRSTRFTGLLSSFGKNNVCAVLPNIHVRVEPKRLSKAMAIMLESYRMDREENRLMCGRRR
jgi:hypothetical protein